MMTPLHAPTAAHERILVALDTPDLTRAEDLAHRLRGRVGGVKIGKEFFTALGPQGALRVAQVGLPVFLDLKFHDIPNTVAGAVRAAAHLGAFMINVHAVGGEAMLRAARRALLDHRPRPLLIAVTVLTSMGDDDLAALGIHRTVHQQVVHLARLARDCELDGVVCSAHEIEALRAVCGPDFVLVTPGIRPAWAAADDQKRIVTPAEAVARGADYLVIGRPITGADDPAAAAERIAAELAAGA